MGTATDALFRPLTVEAAPEESKPVLQKIKKSLGFIPNLLATLADNPAVLQGYLALEAAFEKGSFTPRERHLILLAVSVENNCNYCGVAHSAILKGALHVPPEVVSAVRYHSPLRDARLDALVTLVKELVRERGYAKDETIQKFLAAGYKREQMMELLLGIALKTISNYLDHLSPTPVDQAFAAEGD